jgi:hypothetical protein
MLGVTVSAIVRDLERRTQARQMDALADLDTAHADAVRAALLALKPRARIDLPVLLDSVRREVAAEQSGMTPADIAAIDRRLDRLHVEADARGIIPGDAAYYGLSLDLDRMGAADDVEPDPDPDDEAATRVLSMPALQAMTMPPFDDDDDEPAKPRRRSIPRKRSRRLMPKPKSKPTPPEPFALTGIATFNDGYRLGPEPGFTSMRPPWLLDAGDETETEDEEEATA